ncbi:MAG: UDP-glucose--hexose-1-phosphate uridylyltransferase [Clostridia bacterium]|nr:UDP-glucose--hexose-1-phosphate uridylyltransferase [Clostridia bacterium]
MAVTSAHEIERMLLFAVQKGLIDKEDMAYTRNRLFEIMEMDAPDGEVLSESMEIPDTLTPILEALSDTAASKGLIRDTMESRDLFSAKLAGAVTPSPYEVRRRFQELYNESKEKATEWFYEMCRAADYIKVDRINKNARFFEGGLEITINLSKPEKDPRDIANALKMKSAGYPKCMLCIENPGYAGRPGFPARQNHRMIPVTVGGESWHMQYSPYLYYNEHCIVLSDIHRPMKINKEAFGRLFDFVEQYPHYFLGSNADLPIVGGSILTHDHFQGGCYEFPMDKAGDEIVLDSGDAEIAASIVDWPMSCIRLKSKSREKLIERADRILSAWREYSDAENDVYAFTDQKHNTITPIVRKSGGAWKMDLVLRNNRTSDEHPLGIFHPHSDLHHIKKENIGLIEVMGLMILPGRLLKELDEAAKYLTGDKRIEDGFDKDAPGACHFEWITELVNAYGNQNTQAQAEDILRKGVAGKCCRVLADAGVFKQTEKGRKGFVKFLETVGFQKR